MTKVSNREPELSTEEALALAISVFNQREQIRGFTPAQHILGQNLDQTERILGNAVPPELLVEHPDGEFHRAAQRRAEAEKALIDWTTQQRLVRAQNSRTKPAADYRPGELVYFWRSQTGQQGRRQPGNRHGAFLGPARILAFGV